MARSGKPWYRLRNVVLLLLAVFLGWLGREVYLALSATPGQRVDYLRELQALVKMHQPAGPEAPDAWPLFRQAVEIAESVSRNRAESEEVRNAIPEDYSVVGYLPERRMYDDRFTYEQVQGKAIRGVAQLRDAGLFEVQAGMAAAPRAVRPMVRPQSGHLFDILLPDLGRARNLARINAARLYLAHEAGDDAEFAATYEQMLALGRVCAQQGLLIDQLVGIAIVSLANNRARELLTERPISPEALRAMLAAIDRQALPSPLLAIEAERIATRDIIQWTHTDDGRGNGRLIMSEYMALGGSLGVNSGRPGGIFGGLQGTRLLNMGGLFFASKAATSRKADLMFDGFAKAAVLPRSRREDSLATLEAAVETLSVRYLVLKMVVPAIGAALRTMDLPALDAAGMKVMLALELHRHRTGEYPESLEELAPATLTAVPVDPWTEQPLRYRRYQPGEDELGRGYLLYALGADGVDNGGKVNRKNPWLANRKEGARFDYVLNLPRLRPEPEPEEPQEYDEAAGEPPT